MGRGVFKVVVVVLVSISVTGCEGLFGPDKSGEIHLSSQLFGTDSYYLFGYSYEKGDFYKYPYQGEPVPDIINEAFRVIKNGDIILLPGFNTPGQMNGFALAGEFETLEDASAYYEGYNMIGEGLQFETVSDTVELYQVWIQKTSADNYVKLLIKDIQNFEDETGAIFNEVTMDFTYQPDGSSSFPK